MNLNPKKWRKYMQETEEIVKLYFKYLDSKYKEDDIIPDEDDFEAFFQKHATKECKEYYEHRFKLVEEEERKLGAKVRVNFMIASDDPHFGIEYDYYNSETISNLESEESQFLSDFLNEFEQDLKDELYEMVLMCLMGIVDGYVEMRKINSDKLFQKELNRIGKYLKKIYLKGDEYTKQKLKEYIEELEENKYYNNSRLKDIIINLVK